MHEIIDVAIHTNACKFSQIQENEDFLEIIFEIIY